MTNLNQRKDFDNWNDLKKNLDQIHLEKNFLCHQKEIWWCSLGLNVGIEADGKNDSFERPVLVLKVFNSEMVWILPITSIAKRSPFYYEFVFKDTDQTVSLTQIKTISTKRLRRKIGIIQDKDFVFILEKVKNFLK